MMQRSLAETLRVLRARRGWSLSEAGKRLGVNRQTLRSLEVGERTPYYPTLLKIAQGYGVPVEDLMELESPKAPSLLTPRTWQAWLSERGLRHLATAADEFGRWFSRLSETERDEVLDEVLAERRRIRSELRDEHERTSEGQREFIETLDTYTKARSTEILLQSLGWEPAADEGDDDEETIVNPTIVEVTSVRDEREQAEHRLEALAG